MSPNDLHDFLAVLALIALAGAVSLVLARLIPSAICVRYLDLIHKAQVPLAALVATTASLGSLYFSEYGNHWIPCRFCWFQRIFMYSSAVILIIAAIRRDRGIKWYAAPLASIGIVLSFWHILIEHHVVEESKLCVSVTSCANPWHVSFGKQGVNSFTGQFEWSGMPMTLAVMAFCGFAAILALLLIPEALPTPELPTPETLEEEEDGEPAAG